MRLPFAAGGYTLLELLVGVAMLAVLGSTAFLSLRPTTYDLDLAAGELVANLRVGRSYAISRGVHYRVVVLGPSSYAVQRLRDEGGVWEADPSESRSVSLSSAVRFTSPGGTAVDFDSRGMLVAAGPATLSLVSGGGARSVRVWPSGQIERT